MVSTGSLPGEEMFEASHACHFDGVCIVWMPCSGLCVCSKEDRRRIARRLLLDAVQSEADAEGGWDWIVIDLAREALGVSTAVDPDRRLRWSTPDQRGPDPLANLSEYPAQLPRAFAPEFLQHMASREVSTLADPCPLMPHRYGSPPRRMEFAAWIIADMGPLPANPMDVMLGAFDDIRSGRRGEAGWWLPDGVDPFRPLRVDGLADHLPTELYRLRDCRIHALEQVRALLIHRHACANEPPGRLFTARRRLTRGPNVRRSTQILCRPVGLVRL